MRRHWGFSNEHHGQHEDGKLSANGSPGHYPAVLKTIFDSTPICSSGDLRRYCGRSLDRYRLALSSHKSYTNECVHPTHGYTPTSENQKKNCSSDQTVSHPPTPPPPPPHTRYSHALPLKVACSTRFLSIPKIILFCLYKKNQSGGWVHW